MYAIVPSRGRYGSGSKERPARVCRSLTLALRLASRWTRAHQAAMRPHGGTSGGWRVVEVAVPRRDMVWWYGHDLDRVPSVGEQ